ncbi:hypothetical protein ACJIZ3_025450 [Penstemon smallii]|uniref:SAWADEE domain-containing protein n=1 Tax=Penstemon smallii TaxID=265156 RepID=A0ABD3TUP0_9LAMI
MDDECYAMEMEEEDGLPEFTLAEIIKLENLSKEIKSGSITEDFCQELAAKFSCSTHRSETSSIKWEQVRNWFQDKQIKVVAKVTPPSPAREEIILASSKALVLMKKRERVPTISASESAVEVSNLIFEARSAKDYAWFDVGSFLNYRVLCSGELVVRVRFAGFGNEEDEWVSVRRAVRERSIPLEHSECDKVNVGDLVLCFREAEDDALYCDAHIMEIERKIHDSNACTCIFVVRYDHDNVEGKVPVNKLCRRPTQPVSKKEAWGLSLCGKEPNGPSFYLG